MCKENFYAKMEKLEAEICRCTRQGLKVTPWDRPSLYTRVGPLGLLGFGYSHQRKIINTVLRKLFDLRCGNQLPYAQFLGTHKRKLFDLWKGNQLYTIFGLAQAKFSLCDYWFK